MFAFALSKSPIAILRPFAQCSCAGTLSLAYLLPQPIPKAQAARKYRLALFLLTIAGIIFRSELALLIGSYFLILLVRGRVSLLRDLVPTGLLGLLIGLGLTVPIDTFFWQSRTSLWPELSAFVSNVFPSEGSEGASAWGTSPWYWYFVSALPRLLMNPTLAPLILASLTLPATRSPSMTLLIPPLLYISLYSILPHKETRFIMYTVPIFTLVAAQSASYISNRRAKSPVYRLATLLILISTLLTALVSYALLLPLSSLNYPGGHALNLLHNLTTTTTTTSAVPVHVHLDNLATQTGVTRFQQLPGYCYDKSESEDEKLTPAFWEQFDYVVTETPGRCIGSWEIIGTVRGLGRPHLVKRSSEDGEGNGEVVKAMYGDSVGRLWDVVVENGPVRTVWDMTVGKRIGWPVLGMEDKLFVLKKGQGVAV